MTENTEDVLRRDATSLAEDKATETDEFEALRSQIPEDGPPTHTDLLEDDESPGQYWQHTYPMNPVVTNGVITAWQCDGCGYEQAVTDGHNARDVR